jgi:hypothetical protein
MKNSLLIRRLASYTMLAASFIAVAKSTEGQIVYTDIISLVGVLTYQQEIIQESDISPIVSLSRTSVVLR